MLIYINKIINKIIRKVKEFNIYNVMIILLILSKNIFN